VVEGWIERLRPSARAHAQPARSGERARIEADHTAGFDNDALGAQAGEELRAPAQRGRHVGEVGRAACAGRAAVVTYARAVAARRVAAQRAVRVVEHVAAARDHAGHTAKVALIGVGDIELLLDALEVGRHAVGR
jgi:hypothetical protein